MRYLLLCCFDEKNWDAMPAPRRDGIMREYSTLLRDLDNSGHYIASARLQSTSTATTIRGRNGKAFVTDGPYAETKEQLGGYHLIECRDINEAMDIAKRIPTLPYGGTVEVRPLHSN